MKYLITIASALIYCNCMLSQILPMPLSDAKWMTKKYAWDGLGGTAETEYRLYTGSDTIIDGQTYTKILLQQLWHTGTNPDGTTFDEADIIDIGTAGWMRNEDLRTYFRFNGTIASEITTGNLYGSLIEIPSDTTILLYDFTMTIGDTLFTPYTHEYMAVIESIDSVLLVDGMYHKVFHFSNMGGEAVTWTEQCGSNFGFLAAFHSGAFFYGSNFSLDCLAINGKYLLGEDSCDYRLSTPIKNLLPEEIPQWDIYASNIYITYLPVGQHASVEIYAANGQQLLQKQVATPETIPLPDLAGGMYIAVLRLNNQAIYSRKFLWD